MKSTIKKLRNCKHALEISLPPEKVKEVFDEVYGDIGKYVSVPGFRKGKAPRDLLELHYSKTAREEVLKKLIPETYEKILGEHRLDPIGYPDITDVKLDINEGFSYKASIEIRPEVSLKHYKGLKLKRKGVEVRQEDIDKELEYLRELHSQNVPKEDIPKEKEDVLKEANVPKEDVPKEDGQAKEKALPKLDDEFAKDIGFENMDRLKAAVSQSLKLKLEEESRADLEIQVIDKLVDSIDFEVPESLVNSEKERLLKHANSRIMYMEALQKKQNPDKKFELDEKDKKELELNAYNQAVAKVKVFFILDRIAEIEKILVKHEELDKGIEEMATRYKRTKEEIRDYLEKGHGLDELTVNIRNNKVMEFLLREARIE